VVVCTLLSTTRYSAAKVDTVDTILWHLQAHDTILSDLVARRGIIVEEDPDFLVEEASGDRRTPSAGLGAMTSSEKTRIRTPRIRHAI
jgi:hypothetical protein